MKEYPRDESEVKSPLSLSRLHCEYMERMARISNPYDLLAEVELQRSWDRATVGVRLAMKMYPRFISLVASYPTADVDALIHVAKRVFRVCIPTMRKDVKDARALEALSREVAS